MSYLNCAPSEILADLTPTCDDELTQGVGEIIYVFQLRNLANPPVRDATEKNIIRDLTMKTGKYMSRYYGFGLSNKPSVTRANTDAGPTFNQKMDLVLAINNPKARREVEALNFANDVAFIYKLNGVYGMHEELGLINGMTVTGYTYEPANTTAGAMLLTLENTNAKRLNNFVQHQLTTGGVKTDDTAAWLESLCRPLV